MARPSPDLWWPRRRGQTLLEVSLAVALLAGTLVPALTLTRKGLEYSRDIERRNMLVVLATSTLEQHAALTSADWTTGNIVGGFASQGYPELLYSLRRSDATGEGGIPDRLMALEVTAWHDQNGNATRDGDESYVVFATKVSKLSAYPP